MKAIFTLLILLYLELHIDAQVKLIADHTNSCKIDGDCLSDSGKFNTDVFLYSSHTKYQNIVHRIASTAIINNNFELLSASTSNACAIVFNRTRYIYYSQYYMDSIERTYGKWAPYFVLCHEIAHHINFDPFDILGSRPTYELVADRWAGSILRKMGADKEETVAWANNCCLYGDMVHPPRKDRVEAVLAGWNEESASIYNFLYYDDFSQHKTWALPSDSNVQMSIQSGKFNVKTAKSNIVFQSSRYFEVDINKDFEVSAKTFFVKGDTNKILGLYFASSEERRYYFGITSSGYFCHGVNGKDGWIDIIPRTKCPNVHKQSNFLKCKKQNDELIFFVNHKEVARAPFNGFTNIFGFMIGGDSIVQFDDFRLEGFKK